MSLEFFTSEQVLSHLGDVMAKAMRKEHDVELDPNALVDGFGVWLTRLHPPPTRNVQPVEHRSADHLQQHGSG